VEATLTVKSFHFKLYFCVVPMTQLYDAQTQKLDKQICFQFQRVREALVRNPDYPVYAAAIIASIFENLKKKRKNCYSLVADVKIDEYIQNILLLLN
jgi:hypothetical protein